MDSASAEAPAIRWGIIATGLICSWFVDDLLVKRNNPAAKHIIQAIASSSIDKARAFAEKHVPGESPAVYGKYEDCYNDPNVDVIYIGTPHSVHKQNCLDAIAAGKHVLCEKALSITAAEAREIFEAARQKGVYVMEAMWTRHFPLVKTLRRLLHDEKIIGTPRRAFCDFARDQKLADLPAESRLKDPKLGAGSLLDMGVYSLTWIRLSLDAGIGATSQAPRIAALQTLSNSIDVASSAILLYPGGQQGIMTSQIEVHGREDFCRIEGSHGYISVGGLATSVPQFFTVYSTKASGDDWEDTETPGLKSKKFEFQHPGLGFYWEADAVALDIAAGKKESDIMPWDESIKVLETLDEIRRQGGARFPQDDQ